MKTISRYIMTLALLLTAVGGAWAQDPVDGTIAWSAGNEASATVSASIMDAISSTGVTTGSGLDVSTGVYFNTGMVKYQPATANAGNVSGVMIEYTIEAVDGYKFKPTGVDYAAVKDGTDNASYSWSYTIDGVESAITDVSMSDVLRSSGSNSATAQLMHSESITADGCSVFTLRFYISNCSNTKKICIGNITISGSVSAAPEPDVEVTTNAAEEGATFTEATFQMPAFDATADYELVRDITQQVDLEVRIDGTASTRIRIAKDTEGHYNFVTTEGWQYAAVDKINNVDLTNGELNYSFKKKEGEEYVGKSELELSPGIWRLEATANEGKPYVGTIYGHDIELYAGYDITVPAGEYVTYFKNEKIKVEDANAELYTITTVGETIATLSSKLNVAPASTPLLVYNNSTEQKTFLLIPATEDADAVTPASQFKGTLEAASIPASTSTQDNYALNGKAFVWVKNALNISANKCWLQINYQLASTRANTRSIVGGNGTTGIDAATSDDNEGDYYDLQGRKVEKPNRKGIYIQNGKKVIVR